MSRIVSVHSFRGGTGKSNLAANIAATLAGQGRRVGIVDADLPSPGLHLLFGFDETRIVRTLNDYLWGRCPIEETVMDVSGVLSRSDEVDTAGGAIFLVPSSLKMEEIARVLSEGYDSSRFSEGLKALCQILSLDFLFVDTHPGLNEETLLSIALSDVLVTTMRPDKQDYLGTAVTVDIARKLNVPRLLMVVNKVTNSYDFDALEKTVEVTYDMPVAGVLPLNEEMARLGSSDIFTLCFPAHPFSRTIRAITGQLLA